MIKSDIEKLLSQSVINSDIYKDALTHRSASNKNNETLEFFGDAILGFIVAEYLYENFPNDDEGSLSRKRSYLVRKETLSKIATYYNIGNKVIVGQGERKSGGNRRDSIISDTLEALIAVVYIIDGPTEAKSFIHKIFKKYITDLPSNDDLKDPKTKLQELLQSHNCNLPIYETNEIYINKEITFETLCKIDEYKISEKGVGQNKRKSQQEAASKAFKKVKEIYKK